MRYSLGRFDTSIVSRAAIVVITGNEETSIFCQRVADLIRQKNSEAGELWTCDSLAEFEQRARTPAFLGRWWYSGSADNLSAEDKRAFDRLLKKPVEFGTAILTGVDFLKYRKITKGLKMLSYAHEIMTSFPSERYILSYIQQEVYLRGAKISQDAAKTFMWRLGEMYSRYPYYLDLLVSELCSKEISKEHVLATLKGVQGASFDDFFSYLLRPLSSGKLNRTTQLFQTCRCMIDDMGAVKTLNKVHKKALQYLELRRLINEGYIPVGVSAYSVEALSKLLKVNDEAVEAEDEAKSVKKGTKVDGQFTYKDILRWSDGKLNREVKIAAQAPLADWYTVALLSGRRCRTEMEAERVLFDIVTRSRRSDVLDLK